MERHKRDARLGTLGGDYSHSYGISGNGLVVGNSDSASASLPFIWDAVNGMEPVGLVSGGHSGTASAVNDAGLAVGFFNATTQYAFRWTDGGGAHDVGTPGIGYFSIANDINVAGQVVGVSGNSLTGDPKYAFLGESVGGIQSLGSLLPGGWSEAHAINGTGQVVGDSKAGTGAHAFLWDSVGGMQDLGTLSGGNSSVAYDINDVGQAVGLAYDPVTDTQTPVIWDSSQGLNALRELIPSGSGWDLLGVSAINNAGQIVGYGTIGGEVHPFLLNPVAQAVPEPGSVAVLVLGLLGLVARRRRRSVGQRWLPQEEAASARTWAASTAASGGGKRLAQSVLSWPP